MKSFCLNLVFLGIASGALVLILLAVRWILKQVGAPKKAMLFLWTLLAFRLLIPPAFSLPSGLLPAPETLFGSALPTVTALPEPSLKDGEANAESSPLSTVPGPGPGRPAGLVEPEETGVTYLALVLIYAAGVLGMLVYYVISYLKVYRKLRRSRSVGAKDGVYLSGRIRTPFVFGIVFGRIYLPFDLSKDQTRYVLTHERVHLRRGDSFWKTVAFLMLAANWYNPLLWVAYHFFAKDQELSCDERTVALLGDGEQKNYARTLFELGLRNERPRKLLVDFAETGLRERIAEIMKKRQHLMVLSVLTILLALMASACLFAGSRQKDGGGEETAVVNESLSELDRMELVLESLEDVERGVDPLLADGTYAWENPENDVKINWKQWADSDYDPTPVADEQSARINAYMDLITWRDLLAEKRAKAESDEAAEYYKNHISDLAYSGLKRMGVKVYRPGDER